MKKLPPDLQNEAIEKIEKLRNRKNHSSLKVHKLHGQLAGFWSFSVNYDYRIIFEYESKGVMTLLAVGNHEIYK